MLFFQVISRSHEIEHGCSTFDFIQIEPCFKLMHRVWSSASNKGLAVRLLWSQWKMADQCTFRSLTSYGRFVEMILWWQSLLMEYFSWMMFVDKWINHALTYRNRTNHVLITGMEHKSILLSLFTLLLHAKWGPIFWIARVHLVKLCACTLGPTYMSFI